MHRTDNNVSEKMTIHDPLTISLTRQTRSLLSKIPPESPYAADIAQASSPGTLLDTLSHLLTVPALTLSIATAFRPLLLDLCARWLNYDENKENKLVALCLLLEPHQELYP
jgi:midasin